VKRRIDDSHAEMLRRLRLGNLRKLFRHRYGPILPDDDAGRAELRELLLPISVSANSATKMPKAIELWAPWMGQQEALALIDDINRTPIWQRKPDGKVLGDRLRATNAHRERLKLWTIAACDMSEEEAKEWRKAKHRERNRRLRQLRGGTPQASSTNRTKPWLTLGMSRASWYRRETVSCAELKTGRNRPHFGETTSCEIKLIKAEHESVSPEQAPPPKKGRTVPLAQTVKSKTPTKPEKPKQQRGAPVDAAAPSAQRTKLSQEAKMASQERKLEHGLQVMLDILTGYLGNAATRTEWLVEIQKRFSGRNGKLRRGWSKYSFDRKVHKLEQLGLITGGRGFGVSYSAVAPAQPGQAASGRKSVADSAELGFLDVLKAAKQQLLKGSKSTAA